MFAGQPTGEQQLCTLGCLGTSGTNEPGPVQRHAQAAARLRVLLSDQETLGLVHQLEMAFRDVQRAPPASETDTTSTADFDELDRMRRLSLQPPRKRRMPATLCARTDLVETAHEVYKIVQQNRTSADTDATASDDGWRELAASCVPCLYQVLRLESADEQSVLWVGAGDLAEIASLAMDGARMWIRAVEINAAAVRAGHALLDALGASGDERSRIRQLRHTHIQYDAMDAMELRKARGFGCIYSTIPVPELGAHLRGLAWTAGARLCLLSRVFARVGAPVRAVERYDVKMGGSGEKVVLVCGLVHGAHEW